MLFPKPVRRVFFLLVFLVAGYYGYNVLKPHLTQEATAFKRYSNALMDGSKGKARELAATDYALAPFASLERRRDAIQGDVRLVFHRIRSLRTTDDGNAAKLVVRQIIRYDPPGQNTFWGAEELVNNQHVTMVREQSFWKVESYQDNWFPTGL
jgi:type IV secretory pathway VirB3-like protein